MVAQPKNEMTVQTHASHLTIRAFGEVRFASHLVFCVPTFRFLPLFSHAKIHRSLKRYLRLRYAPGVRGPGVPSLAQRLEGGRRRPRPQVICGRVCAKAAFFPRQELWALPDRRLEDLPRPTRQGTCKHVPAPGRSRSRTRAPCEVRRSDAIPLKRSFLCSRQRTVGPSGSRALTAPAVGFRPERNPAIRRCVRAFRTSGGSWIETCGRFLESRTLFRCVGFCLFSLRFFTGQHGIVTSNRQHGLSSPHAWPPSRR